MSLRHSNMDQESPVPKRKRRHDDDGIETPKKRPKRDIKHLLYLYEKAQDENLDDLDQQIEEYEKKNYNPTKINHLMSKKMSKANRASFFELYEEFLVTQLHMDKVTIHKDVFEHAKQMHKSGIALNTAAYLARKCYESQFPMDKLFREAQLVYGDESENSESETDDSEEQSESDDDEDTSEAASITDTDEASNTDSSELGSTTETDETSNEDTSETDSTTETDETSDEVASEPSERDETNEYDSDYTSTAHMKLRQRQNRMAY